MLKDADAFSGCAVPDIAAAKELKGVMRGEPRIAWVTEPGREHPVGDRDDVTGVPVLDREASRPQTRRP
jgi:hypothetical protein